MRQLCTIGYEGTSLEDLVASLKAESVTRLLDVRFAPYSRRDEYSIEMLRPALADYGIAYTHIRELGNPPAGREAARLGHRAAYREIYTGHLASPDGQAGLRKALAFAALESVCLMCLERDPRHCHRSMTADALAAQGGFSVAHLKTSRKSAHPLQSTFDF